MLGTRVLILGLGISGCTVATYLQRCGVDVWGYDQRAQLLVDDVHLTDLLANGLQLVDQLPALAFDYAVLSPGFPVSHSICRLLTQRSITIIGEVEFACRHLQYPCIGVTGTNGKTTVTMQIAHTLALAGVPAVTRGNVGIPLTQLLLEPVAEGTVIVLELSSYQLEMLSALCLDAAVLLNITPDHLDRYPSMDAYAAAKGRIALCLKDEAPLYIAREALNLLSDVMSPNIQIFSVDSPPTCSLMIQGNGVWSEGVFCGALPENMAYYERQNLLAVYAVCRHWGVSLEVVLQAQQSFYKPPHRLQHVAQVRGVDFYDDSKGTNTDAVLKAVAALSHDSKKRIHLIAGGQAKGTSFCCWQQPFQNHVLAVYAIGDSASQLKNELGEVLPVYCYSDLQAAVYAAYNNAAANEIVLLSPGCASLDMFTSYAHRGAVFQAIVNILRTAYPFLAVLS
jgi:UDP-N-acetylmuramoylalanine--D-glutamate ligase